MACNKPLPTSASTCKHRSPFVVVVVTAIIAGDVAAVVVAAAAAVGRLKI